MWPNNGKFAGQETDDHGNKLTWPGTMHGFPVRGPARDLKPAEYENLPVHLDFRSRLFKLFIDEDKKAFDAVMERAANGWFKITNRVDRWSDEHCGMITWLEWLEVYGDTNNAGGSNNAS